MAETRKLAAILALDVVGYSRLAGTDEDRILARLRALRSDLFDPIIAVHNGRVVKRTGCLGIAADPKWSHGPSGLRTSSGSLTMLAAMCRASSWASSLAAYRN
jgi:hypothetical protein